jgi:GTP-binding protein
MNSSYLTSAQKATQLPVYTHPEIAFIGRSNSGKSSLLNNLLGRKGLARTSARPGSTQMANFFLLEIKDKHQLIFADLPGYGYQSAGGKTRGEWDELLETYFVRPNLCAFLCLADIRRTWEDFELDFMHRLSQQVPLTIVLTKIDKLGARDVQKRKQDLIEILHTEGVTYQHLHLISNSSRKGIAALQEQIFAHGKPEAEEKILSVKK